jgi:hypothetical protein
MYELWDRDSGQQIDQYADEALARVAVGELLKLVGAQDDGAVGRFQLLLRDERGTTAVVAEGSTLASWAGVPLAPARRAVDPPAPSPTVEERPLTPVMREGLSEERARTRRFMTWITGGIVTFVVIVVLSITPRNATGLVVAVLFPIGTAVLLGGIALALDSGFRGALGRGTFMRVSGPIRVADAGRWGYHLHLANGSHYVNDPPCTDLAWGTVEYVALSSPPFFPSAHVSRVRDETGRAI